MVPSLAQQIVTASLHAQAKPDKQKKGLTKAHAKIREEIIQKVQENWTTEAPMTTDEASQLLNIPCARNGLRTLTRLADLGLIEACGREKSKRSSNMTLLWRRQQN